MKNVKVAVILLITTVMLLICLSGCCQHQYTETIVKPTCTEAGYILKECKNCGLSWRTNTDDPLAPKTGHVKTDWIIEKEETCTEDGLKYKECTVCGAKTDRQTIVKNHTYINNKCSRCNEINPEFPYIEMPEVPVVLHNFSYSGKLSSSFIVKNVQTDDNLLITSYYYTAVIVSLEKTFDASGDNYSSSCKIGYKVYDSNTNSVVKSGTQAAASRAAAAG